MDKLDVNEVPSLALIHSDKVEMVVNPSPEKLTETIDHQNQYYTKWFDQEKMKMFTEIESLLHSQTLFVFIKGTPSAPQCKFTRRLLALLEPYKFGFVDILHNEQIRQWIKWYSKWPTFPQVFLQGKLVGGVDIVEELIQNGEFKVPQEAMKPDHQQQFE